MTGKDAKLEPSSHSNLELQWSAPQLLISATHGMEKHIDQELVNTNLKDWRPSLPIWIFLSMFCLM